MKKGISKKFIAYLNDLSDGKGKEPLAFRKELFDAYALLKDGKETTTISQDVHDTMVKFGFDVKPSGIGWSVSCPSKNLSR